MTLLFTTCLLATYVLIYDCHLGNIKITLFSRGNCNRISLLKNYGKCFESLIFHTNCTIANEKLHLSLGIRILRFDFEILINPILPFLEFEMYRIQTLLIAETMYLCTHNWHFDMGTANRTQNWFEMA